MIHIAAKSIRSFLEETYFTQRVVGPGQSGHLRDTANMLGRYLGREAVLSDLTAATINGFLKSIEIGKSPSTMASRRGHVIAIVMAAVDAEALTPFPLRTVRRYRKSAPLPEAWSPDEVRRLIAAARDLPGSHKGVPRAAWWSAYIATAYETGLRPVDLHRLTRASIAQNGVIAIEQHKTGVAIVRRVRPQTLKLIRSLRRPDTIFGGWLGKDQRTVWFSRIVRAAGLNGTFYKLRSTCGTLVERQHSGRGHVALGNGRGVFERHYLARAVDHESILLPPEL